MNTVTTYQFVTIAEVGDNLESYMILDVLPSDHFTRVHLPGAFNCCVFEVTFLDQVLSVVPQKDTGILLYGASERSMDSREAAAKLSRAGYKNIFILQGGLEEWKHQDRILEGEDAGSMNTSSSFTSISDGLHVLNPENSGLVWTGRNANTSHHGTLAFGKGHLQIRDAILTGELIVDMHSIKNTNLEGSELQEVLVDHLKSDDFFFVDHFPTAYLEMTEGQMVQEPYTTIENCRLKGLLTLRGNIAPLEFGATVTISEAGSLVLESHFDLDRTNWNIIYGSARYFEHLGMHTVFDNITVELRCIFE